MADNRLDNSRLEQLVEEFVKDRQKEKYAEVMEILEKSVILVPVMQPQVLDEEAQRMMREGKPVRISGQAQIAPCLLRKETGEQVLPVFTSAAQIPQERRSPAVLAMPFHVCLSMVMSNQNNVKTMVLNPFTHNFVLPEAILEVAAKRRDAVKNTKTIRVTKEQFGQIVHNKVVLQLLPQYLFEHGEDGLKELQRHEGIFMLQFYKDSYPKGKAEDIAISPEEFSVMTMNVTQDMQITRVDMPDRMNTKGMCYRVYAVRLCGSGEIFYYTFEKTEQGNYIGQVTSDRKHELVEPAPDNGAEIEAVMNLVTRMQG